MKQSRDVRALLRAAGVSEQEIRRIKTSTRRKNAQEQASRERAEQEHLMRQSVELEMVSASARMNENELLVDKSEDFKIGFALGRLFEFDVATTIHKVYNERE